MHADERIARLASRQHGLVTGGQLGRLGLGRGAIRHRCVNGRLRRIHMGVFAVGHEAITKEGRMLAAVMACGGQAVLSHEHAAWLWGLLPPWLEPHSAVINVSVPPNCRRGRRPGIRVHRTTLEARDRTTRHCIPVAAPARTLIDLAAGADLRSLERAVDQALTDDLTNASRLRASIAASPTCPGASALRAVLDAAERLDTLTRSGLEEAFLDLVRGAGLPEPRVNAVVAGLRVDATWPAERVAVELDGYRWHRTRNRMESDRGRETALRRAGWTPVRYSARQVFDQPLLVVTDLAVLLTHRRT